MRAAFDLEGHMTVDVGNQRGEWFRIWDPTIAGNGWGGVPEEASRRVREAFERGGMTLVASLWRGASVDTQPVLSYSCVQLLCS